MTQYRFLTEALIEYLDAIEYYERAQPGLSDAFIRDVENVLASTLEFPEMGSPVKDTPPELNIHRRFVLRFGVELDYLVAGDELIVLAVFHCSRRPGYWRDRLDRIDRAR